MSSTTSVPWPFAYPSISAGSRSHGPSGYSDYPPYKDWLRDEFSFRCIYCLTRERWERDPRSAFGADHVIPRSVDSSLVAEYDNLVYACNTCNSARQDSPLPIDLNTDPIGRHVRLNAMGEYDGVTPHGRSLIDLLSLNLSPLVEARRRVLFAYKRVTGAAPGVEGVDFDLFRFPLDLPDLGSLRPPNGNSKPGGIAACAFNRRATGALADFY